MILTLLLSTTMLKTTSELFVIINGDSAHIMKSIFAMKNTTYNLRSALFTTNNIKCVTYGIESLSYRGAKNFVPNE